MLQGTEGGEDQGQNQSQDLGRQGQVPGSDLSRQVMLYINIKYYIIENVLQNIGYNNYAC